MQAIFETLFDIVYLVSVVTIGIMMIRGSKGRRQYTLFGMMAVILGCGDAFHLVPRAIALCTTGLENYTTALGRIVLCLMPQNEWTSAEAPLSWGIYRNIPFTILGILIVILFCQSAEKTKDEAFRFLYLAVIFSFACYIPVLLFADTVPPVGMLMIPKTCAYVWVVLIGYKAMKGSENY